MEHVVFFPAHDGSPAFRRVADRADAVRLVEHLRNVEGVSEVSVHALTEVPLAFKAWYRVEVPGDAAPDVPAAGPSVLEPTAAEQGEPAGAQAEAQPAQVPVQAPVLASSNGRTVGSASSLGFFAS